MKRKRLLRKLAEFLDRGGRKQRKHRDELKVLLKKLKIKQIELEEKIRLEQDGRKKHRHSKELEIIMAQRAKGVKALRELKEA